MALTATVVVVPPTEPAVELTVSGLKNFQALSRNSFTLTASPSELQELYIKIQEALAPYKQPGAQQVVVDLG